MQNIKNEGAVYTPDSLGLFMSKLLLNSSLKHKIPVKTILDPSVGNGALLLNANTVFPTAKLIGFDVNADSIESAKKALTLNNISDFSLERSNFLASQPNLFNHENVRTPVDAIIANPPYVRTQNLDSKMKSLVKNYNISGRIDLYQAFIVEMAQQLRDGGILCMITSNRYFTTKSGQNTREFLRDNFEFDELIDLGDTNLFDAAVLPAIFVGRKNKSADNAKINFKKIYKESNNTEKYFEKFDDIFQALQSLSEGKKTVVTFSGLSYKIEAGTMSLPNNTKEPWTLASLKDIRWANSLKDGNIRFSDVFNIHVGIKTTADKVYIRDDWSKQVNFSEKSLLHPLIGSKSISKWSTSKMKNHRTILYPYEVTDNHRRTIALDDYPLTKKYLELYKDKLAGRTYLRKSGRCWYEIWVPQNPVLMNKPKVVFPDISEKPKFSLDRNGYLVDGNCYWLSLKENYNTDYLYLAVIVANSSIIQKFHEIEFQNKLYSGKMRYLTQYVSNYPIPNIRTPEAQALIGLCKNIMQAKNPDVYFNKKSDEIDEIIETVLTHKSSLSY